MKKLLFSLFILFLLSCNNNEKNFDATGTFEAVETIISAEASGTIKEFTIEEGQDLKQDVLVGYIDSTQLYLRRKQLEAQVIALLSRRPDIASQLGSLQEQLRQAEHEQKRIYNLAKSEAATSKQVDDINSQVSILTKQLDAQRSSLFITTSGIKEETVPVYVQIDQVKDQLRKSRIINPVKGTVLTKYAEQHEMISAGKALYKVADLSELTLRAYLSGNAFARVKLNLPATVSVDDGAGGFKTYQGVITWISDKAEFTPKTIQTKVERENLVYAIKVKVKNDGFLKIGMYGEVKF